MSAPKRSVPWSLGQGLSLHSHRCCAPSLHNSYQLCNVLSASLWLLVCLPTLLWAHCGQRACPAFSESRGAEPGVGDECPDGWLSDWHGERMIKHLALRDGRKMWTREGLLGGAVSSSPRAHPSLACLFSTLLVLLKWVQGLQKCRLWLCFEHIKLGSLMGLYHS